MSYTEKEIRAFKLKDILNSRMSALKAAATNNEGKGKKAETLKKEADEYYTWLRQDQDTVPEPSKEPDAVPLGNTPGATLGQLPEPTLQQKKVLDKIWAEIEAPDKHWCLNQLKEKVLRWAEKTHGQRSYPTKLESVETFLKWFKTL